MPADLDHREARHREILDRLRQGAVQNQAEMVEYLRERGFDATQSSVSRDLRDLGIPKVAGRYVAPRPPAERFAGGRFSQVAGMIRAITPAGPNLTVLLTDIAAAQRVAVALDREGWEEIAGTIAGDDTVFIASTGAAEQKRLLQRLHAFVGGYADA